MTERKMCKFYNLNVPERRSGEAGGLGNHTNDEDERNNDEPIPPVVPPHEHKLEYDYWMWFSRRPPARDASTTTTGYGQAYVQQKTIKSPPILPNNPKVMLYAWWAWWAAWSSGGGCTRTWSGPRSCPHSPTCTSSSLASNPCGRTPPTFMEANGWSDCAKRRRGARGRTCAWPCWASSSWWAPSSAGSCSLCASRTTTWRCGTGRRRTWRRRRACATLSAASCSCRPPRPSSTRRTATACAPPRRPRRRRDTRTSPTPTPPPPPSQPSNTRISNQTHSRSVPFKLFISKLLKRVAARLLT